jgi:hypothetical protein
LTPRAAVGSSRISTLAPKWTALAARQGADRLVDVAQVDAHVEQFLLGHLAHGGDVHGRALADLVAEEEVAPDRHQRDHR